MITQDLEAHLQTREQAVRQKLQSLMAEKAEEMRQMGLADPEQPAAAANPPAVNQALQEQLLALLTQALQPKKKEEGDGE